MLCYMLIGVKCVDCHICIPPPPAATIAALNADELSVAPVGSARYGAFVTSMPLEHPVEPSAEDIAAKTSSASIVTDAGAAPAPARVRPDGFKTAIDTAGSELTSQQQPAMQVNTTIAGSLRTTDRMNATPPKQVA